MLLSNLRKRHKISVIMPAIKNLIPANKIYVQGTDETISIGGRQKKQFREDFERCFGQTS